METTLLKNSIRVDWVNTQRGSLTLGCCSWSSIQTLYTRVVQYSDIMKFLSYCMVVCKQALSGGVEWEEAIFPSFTTGTELACRLIMWMSQNLSLTFTWTVVHEVLWHNGTPCDNEVLVFGLVLTTAESPIVYTTSVLLGLECMTHEWRVEEPQDSFFSLFYPRGRIQYNSTPGVE